MAVFSLVGSVQDRGHIETDPMFAALHWVAVAVNLALAGLFLGMAFHKRWAFVLLTAMALLLFCAVGAIIAPSPYIGQDLLMERNVLILALVFTFGYVIWRLANWDRHQRVR
jgi:uncharacterized membrane protein YbjE (DUF340 family)